MRSASQNLMFRLAILLGLLALVDVFLSSWILGAGGLELNPLMAPFAGNPAGFLGVKSLALASILLLALLSRPVHEDAGSLILISACGVAIQPVVWNAVLLWLSL